MTTSEFDVISHALVMVGEPPITRYDSSTAGIVSKQLYEATVEAEICRGQWRFARRVKQLFPNVTEPEGSGYALAYERSAEDIKLLTVKVGGYPIDYEVDGRNILCDTSEDTAVYAHYMFRAAETDWAPDFRQYIEHRMASLFGGGIATKADLAAFWGAEADKLMGDAAINNQNQVTSKDLSTNRFARNRSGYSRGNPKDL